MKKLFFKRNIFFFITLVILVIGQFMLVGRCLHMYERKVVVRTDVESLSKNVQLKLKSLPQKHIDAEHKFQQSIQSYKDFVEEAWPIMTQRQIAEERHPVPSNHVALFFEISDYLNWAKDSCDAFCVEYDTNCTFGFKDVFDKNSHPLMSEIFDLHQQKEQLCVLLSHLFESRVSFLKILSIERGDNKSATYFRKSDVFENKTRTYGVIPSHVYKLRYIGFTPTLRNFMQRLYEDDVPVIYRSITVHPNYSVKLTKNQPDQVLECLASTVTLVVEVLDVPYGFISPKQPSASLIRKMEYMTLP